MSEFEKQLQRVKGENGFIAALDQSGGSTPKALGLYGVTEDAWDDDAGMYRAVHDMRSRIMCSKSFTGDRVLGAILFEDTMEREVAGKSTADYLWKVKNVVPFLKVDIGLEDEQGGRQLLKSIPKLDDLLDRANARGIFGTKMRSVVKQADAAGVDAIVKQQFEIGRQILAKGLVPILEPEVDIHCPDKAKAEDMLKAALLKELDTLDSSENMMLKLTLPENANQYKECIEHARILRVVALSGGYAREEANQRLQKNNGMIASFSRALAEGLNAKQSEAEFDSTMDATIESIFQASRT